MRIPVTIVVIFFTASSHSIAMVVEAAVVMVFVVVIIHFGLAPARRHAMQLDPVAHHLDLLFGAQRVARLQDQAHEAEESRHVHRHGFAEIHEVRGLGLNRAVDWWAMTERA